MKLKSTIKFKAKKYGPKVGTIAGLVGLIGAGVWACKQSTKLPELMNKHKQVMETIEDAKENDEDYSEEDASADTLTEYKHITVEVIKLYGAPVAIAVGSTVCVIGSHVVLTRRNAALASACTVISNQFKNYRKNVIEELGEEVDKQFRFNLKKKSENAEESENEDEENPGGENSEKQDKSPTNKYSDYARIFDESSYLWTKDPEANLLKLRQQEDYANRKLKSDGVLFLNDVYELLGFRKTKMGQVMGWFYEDEGTISDNYVDFGIYDLTKEKARDFVNGYERSIVLDFNCVPILEYM